VLRFFEFLQERNLEEGNPLARVHKFEKKDRPTAAITGYRAGKSDTENKAAMKSFDKDLRAKGYGFRKSEGTWEGGKEPSRFVTAKGKGNRHVKQFKRDMTNLSAKYDQDAVAIRHKKTTNLVGTNDTGYPGRGKVDNVGKTVYNKQDADFKTEFRPSKPAGKRPTFTTKE
jgi:hypothetical protein